jgi:mono/diheme cytochrome c family protein
MNALIPTHMFKFLVAALLSLGLSGLAGAAEPGADGIDRHGMVNDIELPSDAKSLEVGKERYSARCSYCHTPLGRGGSSGVCLACQKYKWGSTASAIYATIAAGRPNTKMGAFGNPETGLTGEQILSVIAYIRQLQEQKIQEDLQAAKSTPSEKQ